MSIQNVDIKDLKLLLSNVKNIADTYHKIAEATGENYNIFKTLGVYYKETKHSRFLGDLLNPKGSHGQGDLFLKLFIEEVLPLIENQEGELDTKFPYLKELNSYNTIAAKVRIEDHLGSVNLKEESGGYIDININSNDLDIIIENKIHAQDQNKQLVRYSKSSEKYLIIYLTLYGDQPGKQSRGKLEEYKDFICFSYKDNMLQWLEKCHKEVYDLPILRETLKQYIFLVKRITKQSTSHKMNQEITKYFMENPKQIEGLFTLQKYLNSKSLILEILERRIKPIFEELKVGGTILEYDWSKWSDYDSGANKILSINKFNGKEFEYIKPSFKFNSKEGYQNFIFGLRKVTDKYKQLDTGKREEIENDYKKTFSKNSNFNTNNSKSNLMCSTVFKDFSDWEDSNVIKRILNGNFEEPFKVKIKELSKIALKAND